MKKATDPGINFFQRYLTVWVFLCMVVGVLLGHFLPTLPALLARLEFARISIPMAILIWVMIYPMMLKVDFQSVRNVGKNPKGLFVTWIVNWLIKPFTMYGIASLFFFVIFKNDFTQAPLPTTRCSSNIKNAFSTSLYFPILFQLSTTTLSSSPYKLTSGFGDKRKYPRSLSHS